LYYFVDYCFSSFLTILTLKRAGFFGSDWWEGAVFSVLISGGSRRSPAPKERGAMRRGQACPPSRAAQARRAGIPRQQVAEKTNPGASELTESPTLGVKVWSYTKLSAYLRS